MHGHETDQFHKNLYDMLMSQTPAGDCPVALGQHAGLLYIALPNSTLHGAAVILTFGII